MLAIGKKHALQLDGDGAFSAGGQTGEPEGRPTLAHVFRAHFRSDFTFVPMNVGCDLFSHE